MALLLIITISLDLINR